MLISPGYEETCGRPIQWFACCREDGGGQITANPMVLGRDIAAQEPSEGLGIRRMRGTRVLLACRNNMRYEAEPGVTLEMYEATNEGVGQETFGLAISAAGA